MTARAREFPIGNRLRLAELARDPYPHYHALLRQEPVSWMA